MILSEIWVKFYGKIHQVAGWGAARFGRRPWGMLWRCQVPAVDLSSQSPGGDVHSTLDGEHQWLLLLAPAQQPQIKSLGHNSCRSIWEDEHRLEIQLGTHFRLITIELRYSGGRRDLTSFRRIIAMYKPRTEHIPVPRVGKKAQVDDTVHSILDKRYSGLTSCCIIHLWTSALPKQRTCLYYWILKFQDQDNQILSSIGAVHCLLLSRWKANSELTNAIKDTLCIAFVMIILPLDILEQHFRSL